MLSPAVLAPVSSRDVLGVPARLPQPLRELLDAQVFGPLCRVCAGGIPLNVDVEPVWPLVIPSPVPISTRERVVRPSRAGFA